MLIEIWRNAIVREGVERGRSLKELSDETGLSEEDVVQREIELNLIVQQPLQPGQSGASQHSKI
jgi:hypothetical protein